MDGRARRRRVTPLPAPWHVYVLRCADGSLYTGIALDVDARVAQHARGKGARYTRGRGPFTVCATAPCATRGDALRLERAVKALRRAAKSALIAEPGGLAALAGRLAEARAKP